MPLAPEFSPLPRPEQRACPPRRCAAPLPPSACCSSGCSTAAGRALSSGGRHRVGRAFARPRRLHGGPRFGLAGRAGLVRRRRAGATGRTAPHPMRGSNGAPRAAGGRGRGGGGVRGVVARGGGTAPGELRRPTPIQPLLAWPGPLSPRRPPIPATRGGGRPAPRVAAARGGRLAAPDPARRRPFRRGRALGEGSRARAVRSVPPLRSRRRAPVPHRGRRGGLLRRACRRRRRACLGGRFGGRGAGAVGRSGRVDRFLDDRSAAVRRDAGHPLPAEVAVPLAECSDGCGQAARSTWASSAPRRRHPAPAAGGSG